MADMDSGSIVRLILVWLAVFAVVGGIIAQTTGGVSGRGFMEGMWKGVEWYFIVLLGIGIIIAVIWGVGMMSTAINSN